MISVVAYLSHAQDWNYYKPLKSKGMVPADFTEAYANKYKALTEGIDESDARKDRKQKDEFYQRSEYFINEYLTSGDVLFGDTITRYCEKIVDILLKDKPALRKKLRVYVVKSPIVNASATGNGIIFVNLGLIAQVENEAQLAYVLAHEISHYDENHVFDQYVEREKIRNGEDLYRRTSRAEKLQALSTYSKSHELEADSKGLGRYYENSGYSLQAPVFVMDVLQYSYLPFDEIPFDKTYLELSHLKVPEDFLLEEVAPITANDDFDDTESTHPNIKKRKLALLDLISDGSLGKEYLVSEDLFKHCQRLARYENSRLFLTYGNYAEAIYNTFLLRQKYGEDRYQRLTLAKALAGLSVYRNEGELYKIVKSHKKIEGESQQVYYILSRFNKKDLNTFAVAHAYKLYKDYPDDPYVKRIFNRTLHDLVYENDMRPTEYSRKAKGDTSDINLVAQQDSINANRSSKIKNIKRKRMEEKVVSEKDYYLYAFVDFWQDTTFTYRFEDMAEEAEDARNQRDYYASSRGSVHKKYDKNIALGIDKVVFVTPHYLKMDEQAKDGIKYLNTDEGLTRYKDYLLTLSEKVNLNNEMLDYKDITSGDVEKYNDISILKSWIEERLNHENTDAIISDFDYVQHLRDKYNTDYIAYTGNLSLRVRERAVAGRIIYSAIVFPLLPFTVAQLIIPDFESFNYFFLLDLKNGDALMAEYNNYNTGDDADYLRSVIYNYLIQIKDKPKK